MVSLVLILFFMVNVSMAQETDSTDWKLAKDQNGIKIYTRKVKGLKLNEFKAVTTIETSLEQLVDVIRKVDRYVEWMSQLARSYIIDKVNNNEIYIYSESSVPWPISNRDIVTK